MSRRDLIRALGAVGVTTIGAGVLVACGSSDGDSSSATGDAAARGTSQAGEATSDLGAGQATEAAPADGGAAAGGPSVPLADVPVGEARVVSVDGQQVVVARTAEDAAVAFSARCTHQGTVVEVVEGLDLRCPNHGSGFRADDGAVLNGPATRPLDELAVTIEGDSIVFA